MSPARVTVLVVFFSQLLYVVGVAGALFRLRGLSANDRRPMIIVGLLFMFPFPYLRLMRSRAGLGARRRLEEFLLVGGVLGVVPVISAILLVPVLRYAIAHLL